MRALPILLLLVAVSTAQETELTSNEAADSPAPDSDDGWWEQMIEDDQRREDEKEILEDAARNPDSKEDAIDDELETVTNLMNMDQFNDDYEYDYDPVTGMSFTTMWFEMTTPDPLPAKDPAFEEENFGGGSSSSIAEEVDDTLSTLPSSTSQQSTPPTAETESNRQIVPRVKIYDSNPQTGKWWIWLVVPTSILMVLVMVTVFVMILRKHRSSHRLANQWNDGFNDKFPIKDGMQA